MPLDLFVYDFTPEQEQHVRDWIKALRSGEYQQGRTRLQTDVGYCCLGVACDVFLKAHIGLADWWPDGTFTVAAVNDEEDADESALQLPTPVREWLGMTSELGHLTLEDGRGTWLSDLNDDEKWSFAQIADEVERQLNLAVELRAANLNPRTCDPGDECSNACCA